jgi:serine/threonine protein phosphatase PrpC
MMLLKFEIGQSSLTGPRPRNEDAVSIVTPSSGQLSIKGALIAVADGVSGNAGGGEAAQMTVRSISADYYATPDTLEPHQALDTVLKAANRWVLSQASANRDMAGMATTLSMLILRGQRYYLAHVGDTRIYLLRNGVLKLLTTDHVWDRPDMRHVLKRAVGLDQHLTADYADGELQVGDIFVLMSDGVWDALTEKQLHEGLQKFDNPQLVADYLTQAALKNGGADNTTAVVLNITQLGADSFADLVAAGKYLTVPKRQKVGEILDDFEIVDILHDSRTTLLYKVRHTQTKQLFVLKTLQPLLTEDTESCNALLNEEWLAKRVVSQYMPQILPLNAESRKHLYYVMTWHEGETLQQRIENKHHFTIAGATKVGIELMRGIGALHRLNIIHRDIKPANVHQGSDGRIRLLDLGVALSINNQKEPSQNQTTNNPGTPSFMAPELFDGNPANAQTDIYAAGVTLYHLLTAKYPYGEIEPFQRPKFGAPVPPTRYRPDIPHWLENIVQKAVARQPNDRFETAEEMLKALELGELKPLIAQRTPLIARANLMKWQWLAIFSIIANILLLYLLLVS